MKRDMSLTDIVRSAAADPAMTPGLPGLGDAAPSLSPPSTWPADASVNALAAAHHQARASLGAMDDDMSGAYESGYDPLYGGDVGNGMFRPPSAHRGHRSPVQRYRRADPYLDPGLHGIDGGASLAAPPSDMDIFGQSQTRGERPTPPSRATWMGEDRWMPRLNRQDGSIQWVDDYDSNIDPATLEPGNRRYDRLTDEEVPVFGTRKEAEDYARERDEERLRLDPLAAQSVGKFFLNKMSRGVFEAIPDAIDNVVLAGPRFDQAIFEDMKRVNMGEEPVLSPNSDHVALIGRYDAATPAQKWELFQRYKKLNEEAAEKIAARLEAEWRQRVNEMFPVYEGHKGGAADAASGEISKSIFKLVRELLETKSGKGRHRNR